MIERAPALITDLYELTMAAAYFENGLEQDRGVFELFVRRLPPNRNFLITAGLEQTLDHLLSLRFNSEQIDFLRRHPSFANISDRFFDYLDSFRFGGDVWAMPEGTVAFGMEPILRVSAPMIEAQIIETFLLSTINFQTMVASKAARIVAAAAGRDIVEFGTRRAHGDQAGLLAARAAYIAGCAGTSNVEAGHLFGIPTYGTLAHSFVMAFDDEADAFDAFLKSFPTTATVLVDTYDTISAVKRLAAKGYRRVPAVRLDSGDLRQLSLEVRQILDAAGMNDTKIFASGDLNENLIAELLAAGARLDAFGVGTELATSYDAPALPGVYKLVAIERDDQTLMRIKLSHDKQSYPGAKQVWRATKSAGLMVGDIVALADELPPRDGEYADEVSWQPLLEPVIRQGRSIERPLPMDDQPRSNRIPQNRHAAAVEAARARAQAAIAALPRELLSLERGAPYRVDFSKRLKAQRKETEDSIRSLLHRS
jgi:nicotinate phosphoribosyltransferase